MLRCTDAVNALGLHKILQKYCYCNMTVCNNYIAKDCLKCKNSWLTMSNQLNSVSGQQTLTLDTNDIAKNAEGQSDGRTDEKERKEENMHILQLILSSHYLPVLLP
ncbi:hypothetical protein GOODEAATRI_008530 [Goodea atripinnis]|uniref:Uncharacterized protein n=1 Tax=Goodea atripinnis TaxID=208336 RepID=A0ABV0N174_9TELE